MQFGDSGWSERRVIADAEFVVHHGTRGGTWQGGSLLGSDLQPGPYSREVVFLYGKAGASRIAGRCAMT
jgi:hypothetical protein